MVGDGRIPSGDRATRATPQAASRLDHSASVPCAFTPGPWWASATREVFNARNRTVCRAHLDGDKCSRDEALANARLIAAAPEMFGALLEACLAMEPIARRVFNDNGDHTIDTERLDGDVYSACYYAAQSVRDALAKARGEA